LLVDHAGWEGRGQFVEIAGSTPGGSIVSKKKAGGILAWPFGGLSTMQLMRSLGLLGITLLHSCWSYPEYFMMPNECPRILQAGEMIMGLKAHATTVKDLIVVTRGAAEIELKSGQEYREGETLQVKFRAQGEHFTIRSIKAIIGAFFC